jgi:hypothetical protein
MWHDIAYCAFIAQIKYVYIQSKRKRKRTEVGMKKRLKRKIDEKES